ncbi:UNVERIFIED_CONTAM: hypothetical protein H355_006714, partial [Colinus virginianus]
ATSKTGATLLSQVEGRDIPIVHRVLSLHEDHLGNVRMLTKGDNNSVDDRGLYAVGGHWYDDVARIAGLRIALKGKRRRRRRKKRKRQKKSNWRAPPSGDLRIRVNARPCGLEGTSVE